MSAPGMRLARYLAKAGIASRRRCETLIEGGKVTVNRVRVTSPAINVVPGVDRVEYSGQVVSIDPHVYYLLHKPPGYTCTASDPNAERKALDLLHLPNDLRVFSVGRLDKESEGLLLFTNDGLLSQQLSHPRYEIPKTYVAQVHGRVDEEDLQKLVAGIEESGERLIARSARIIGRHGPRASTLEIVVSEGKNREIRRMCRFLGLNVERLVRIKFGPLELKNLAPGKYRALTEAEVARVRKAAGLS